MSQSLASLQSSINNEETGGENFGEYIVDESKAIFTSDTEITLDSEKSHEPLYTEDELAEKITFLSFDLTWMYIATLANVFLFVTYSYEVVFNEDACREVMLILLGNAICDTITIFDITVMIIHTYWKKISHRKCFKTYNKALLTMDIISLISIIHDMSCVYTSNRIVQIIAMGLVCFRMYRVVKYFYIVSLTPGHNFIGNILQKYSIIMFLFVHTFSCLWQYFELYNCVDTLTTENPKWSKSQWYTISSYYVMCQVSNIVVDGSVKCESPSMNLISIAIMIAYYTFICGVFVGAWTSTQVESYRRHADFSRRLRLIKHTLSNRKISIELKRKVHNYYKTFWSQQGGVHYSKMLVQLMPMSIRAEVYLDKYWYFLQQSYLMIGCSEAFQRAIAKVMHTQIYTRGDIVIEKGQEKSDMAYLVRGSLQILSAEDNESPILTLGMGTLLGESSLLLSSFSPVQVIASSYCIIQKLDKSTFWRIANKFINLKENKGFHERMHRKMNTARHCENVKNSSTARDRDPIKILKIVKTQLMVEQPRTEDEFIDPAKKKMVIRPFSDLYILSKQEKSLKSSDEICLHTTWPWILQPQSVLLDIWEYVVVTSVMVVALLYPYQFCFVEELSSYTQQVFVVVDTIYCMDIIFQIFTAVEDGNVIVSSFLEIVSMRCRQLLFILDLIATIPLDHMEGIIYMHRNTQKMSIFTMLRILKFFKVINLMRKLRMSFQLNVAVVRCAGYVLHLLLTAYFLGCFYYMMACKDGHQNCQENSWMNFVKIDDERTGGSRFIDPFGTAMYYSMMLLSKAGIGDLTATNINEIYMMFAFVIIGTLLFSYLVADYSATLMLANRSFSTYMETVDVIRNFLIDNIILQSIQNRVNEKLTLLWKTNEGFKIMFNKSVIYDAPKKLLMEVNYARYASYVSEVPFFEDLDDDFLKAITAKSTSIYLPPNEIITYAGEVPREFYVIEKGYCALFSLASGKTEKILGPKSHFLSFEMLLALPGIFTISTVTNVQLIKVAHTDISNVMNSMNPSLLENLNEVVKDTVSSLAVQRLFIRRSNVVYQAISETDDSSWFVFPKQKLHPRNLDYEQGFKGSSFFKIFRIFLLRRTIMPHGCFIMYWEIGRAISAFILAMIYPPLEVYKDNFPEIVYFKYALDVFAFVDIYIRMHVAYYNERGILVTHPKYTAKNYFSKAFITDLLGAVPTDILLRLFLTPDDKDKSSVSLFHRIKNFLNYNRLLQLYRLPDAFSYWRRDILKPTSLTFNIMKFVPLSLIFINVLASTLLIIMCEFEHDGDKVKMVPQKNSWIVHYAKINLLENVSSIRLYLTAYYWMTSITLSVGFTSVLAKQSNEMYFIIFSILAGYLMFKYVLAIVSSSIASININLTLYQKNIKQLISYMEREKIGKDLQLAAINYFEYIWQRTHGVQAYDIIKRFHLALHQDIALSLYENTFIKVPIFGDCSKSFFRQIGVHIEEAYYLKGTPIIKLNDIVNTIYIVHKGSVVVKGPDGSVFTVLAQGCMFGNLDNIRSTRSMTYVYADRPVDLLLIKTEKFYEVSQNFKSVMNKLQSHILIQNMSYINSGKVCLEQASYTDIQQEKISKVMRILQAANYNLLSMLTAYFSLIFVTYHVAFQANTFIFLAILYIFDFIQIVKLIIGFYMPYQNNLGELVTDRHLIRKRYMTMTRFYAELLSVIPFELIGFAIPQNTMLVMTWLRLNRIFRLWGVINYFNVTFNRLNIKVELSKLGAVCVYFSLMLHFLSCILFIVGCPNAECLVEGWTYGPDKKLKCNPDYLYLCSLYFTTTLTSCAGETIPRAIWELLFCTIIMLVSSCLVSVIIGNLSSIVQNFSYTLVNYDYSMSELKIYLEKSMISEPLIKKVISYANQLWVKENGQQVPEFLREAPTYLREEITAAAYGQHLYENYIFVTCHNDFLRLLICQLNVRTYFAGDMICVQGDVNNKMYFIHKGCVEVISTEHNTETLVDELYDRDCFGIIQGLFVKTPHLHSYRAVIVSVVLSLELKDWLHLIKYYPAARFEIYEKIQHIL